MMMIDPLVGDWVNKRVLDLGCGGGFIAEELSRRGAKVVGVDPSHGAIAAGVDHARQVGLDRLRRGRRREYSIARRVL